MQEAPVTEGPVEGTSLPTMRKRDTPKKRVVTPKQEEV